MGSGCVWEVRYERGGQGGTHVLEHGLHECNGNFGLLNEVVLGVLDFEASLFLSCGAGVLEATTDVSRRRGADTMYGPLLGSIKF